ncbi:MAG: hypothetical protein WCK42_06340 [Myxococcaceae bacterium]
MVERPGILHVPELDSDPETSPGPSSDLSRQSSLSNLADTISDAFEPRSQARKKAGHATTVLDNMSTVADVAEAGALITGLPEPGSIASGILGSAASLSSIAVGGLATVVIGKTANTQLIVKDRLAFTRNLYQESVKNHFPDGLPELSKPDSKTPIKDLLENFSDSDNLDRTATEAVLHVLEFNIGKLDDRTTKLILKQVGADTALAGAVLAGIGAAGLGIGAIFGAIVSAIGAGIGSLPDIHALVKAIYKIYQKTKGVDRNSAANFLWGLALRKGIQEGTWDRDSFSPEAHKAYQLADNWDTLRTNEDMKQAQDIAAKLLEGIGVNDTVTPEEFVTQKGHKKIMARLKSTAET